MDMYEDPVFSMDRWFSARLQDLQCVSNGDTSVLHWVIKMLTSAISLPIR